MDRQETCEIPHASTCEQPDSGTPAEQVSQARTSFLRPLGSASARHEHRRSAWGLERETIRDRGCASGKS